MISFLRTVFDKAPRIPDPGQRVLLLDESGWRPGYRAVSNPITSETGEVVILVAEEEEFRSARWENRFADGISWPVSRMTVPRRDEQRAKRRARRKTGRNSSQRPVQSQDKPSKNGYGDGRDPDGHKGAT